MSKALSGPGLYVGAAALAVGALVAGCGSSSGTAAASTASTASTAAGSSTTAAGASSTAVSSSPAAASPTPSAVTIDISGHFCADARSENSHSAQLEDELDVTDPARLKSVEQSYAVILQQFAAEAPSQIKAQVEVLANGEEQLFKALAAAGYDYKNLNPAALSSLDTPAFQAAGAKVSAYLVATCHIPAATGSG